MFRRRHCHGEDHPVPSHDEAIGFVVSPDDSAVLLLEQTSSNTGHRYYFDRPQSTWRWLDNR